MNSVEEKDFFEIRENCLLIKLPKEIDHHSAKSIREQADLLLLDERVEQLVFDFKRTVFMDSSGIGLLVGRNEKIVYLGGRTIVINVSGRIRRMLKLSGLDKELCFLEEEKE